MSFPFDPRKITPLDDQALNRLFFAVNHYISTGNHIGEGIALPVGGKIQIWIPVSRSNAQDRADMNCLISRLSELGVIVRQVSGPGPEDHNFEMWSFEVREDDAAIDRLAADLREKPGPLGWGSPKATIDAHNW